MGLLGRIFDRSVTTDVLDVLTTQHTWVDELFEQIEKGDRAAFADLANLLAAHATIEEKLFYPAVMAKATRDELFESVEEHLQIKRLLADLIGHKVSDDTFKAKISVLKEEVSHHAHNEEEKKLFQQVKTMLDTDERAALGNQVLVMFEELMATEPRNNVPNETAHAAPLP